MTRKRTNTRLRQVDVKAEHFERQVTVVTQERDDWESKHAVGGSCRARMICAKFSGSRREVPAVKEGARRGCRPDGELGKCFDVSNPMAQARYAGEGR